MKNNIDKDPFAEYDQFWDELDQVENQGKKKIEKVDKGEKDFDDDIDFGDIERKLNPKNLDKQQLKTLISWIIGIIFVGNFIFRFANFSFFWLIIVFAVIGQLFKGGKNG